MKLGIAVAFFLALLVALPARAQNPQQSLSRGEVIDLLKKHEKEPERIITILDAQGVDFDLTQETEQKLREAGATDDVMDAVSRSGPTRRAARKRLRIEAGDAEIQATMEEIMGLQTLRHEPNPDRKLKMVEEFERQFPNSRLTSYIYAQAARAFQMKDDPERAVEFGEKSLKLDPENAFSMTLVALALSQPRMLRGASLEVQGRRLAGAEQHALRALKALDSSLRLPGETADQFRRRKAGLSSDVHSALGMVHMQRNQPDQAIEEFKKAIALAPAASPQLYFRLGKVYASDGKPIDAIEAFTKASELGQGTVLQKYADERIGALKK